jgi:hypothetical protein
MGAGGDPRAARPARLDPLRLDPRRVRAAPGVRAGALGHGLARRRDLLDRELLHAAGRARTAAAAGRRGGAVPAAGVPRPRQPAGPGQRRICVPRAVLHPRFRRPHHRHRARRDAVVPGTRPAPLGRRRDAAAPVAAAGAHARATAVPPHRARLRPAHDRPRGRRGAVRVAVRPRHALRPQDAVLGARLADAGGAAGRAPASSSCCSPTSGAASCSKCCSAAAEARSAWKSPSCSSSSC